MNHDLNEDLDNYDIVTKIQKIRAWYANREQPIPKHIGVFISAIEAMPEYQTLKAHKTNGAVDDVIAADYQAFLNAYFAEESENKLMFFLRNQFKLTFQN